MEDSSKDGGKKHGCLPAVEGLFHQHHAELITRRHERRGHRVVAGADGVVYSNVSTA